MIDINPCRFLDDLAQLRAIGASGSGVIRPALSASDLEARRWLAGKMQDAGLNISWDPVGNLFGIAPGHGPSILVGSHADTQPEGGWLDGAYGVICGLEIARAAIEAGRDDISVVAFSDEESRFLPLLGSRFWTGELAYDDLRDAKDAAGNRLVDAIDTLDELRGAVAVSTDRFRCFLEPHIEQGPVLDRAGEQIGIVTAIAGLRCIEIVFVGEQNHAGTTPMAMRNDALQAFVGFAAALDTSLRSMASVTAVWTIGEFAVYPNAVSIIPGRSRALLQLRDISDEALDAMVAIAVNLAARMNAEGGVSVATRLVSSLTPTRLDPSLQNCLADEAATRPGVGWRRMTSGALHDAGVVGRALPSAMVFVPSLKGVSHSFAEDTLQEHLVLGCAVAAGAIERMAV